MKKLNWFETTLKHHWIHQRIKFQTVFPYIVVSPSNNLMLFLKLISGRLLAHHQRNRAPLIRSLNSYSSNTKTNWDLFFLELLCWISNWTKGGLSYPFYQENNPCLWFFSELQACLAYLSFQSLWNALFAFNLVGHLITNILYEIFQSAYRQLHSTETAPLCVQNDLLQAVNNEGRAILVLLDLSAAFATIDHQKLSNLLNQSFGIRGVALKWLESYLKDGTLSISGRVHLHLLHWNMRYPQGSVPDPILFTMCTTLLGMLFENMGWTFIFTQPILSCIFFQPGVSISKEITISCLEACIKDLNVWMTNKLLKLNDDKTELIVITTHSNTSQNQHIGINIGDSLITPSSEPPWNLGVLIDSTCGLVYLFAIIYKTYINEALYNIQNKQAM